MTITFTGTGGLFTRLGRMFHAIRSANLFSGGTDISAGGLRALGVLADNIDAQFQSTLQNVVDQLYAARDTARDTLSSFKSAMRQLAETTIIEQAHADATLTSKDIDSALAELIRQMGNGSLYSPTTDVDANTVSASVAADSLYTNTGNGQLRCSVKRPSDARDNEHVLAEVLEVVCDADGQNNGGATARQETFTVTGEAAIEDPLAYNWPGGSAATASLTAIDASLDADGNLLYNGDLDSFTTTNQPDNYGSALAGVYGTDIFETAATVYRSGGKALEFRGTGGAPLSSIAQQFGVTSPAAGTSGTSSTLEPNKVYAVNAWARKSAGLLAGVLEFSLVDGSNNYITDDAGNDIKIQIAHGSLTTSFAAVGGFFVTPKKLPTTYKFRIRIQTALTNGESIYVDDVALAEAVELYDGGPWAAMFAGSTDFIRSDRFKLTVANDGAGDFQQYFERCFSMRAKGLQLPSDSGGTEAINDNLIA